MAESAAAKIEYEPGTYILRETIYAQEHCSLTESFNATDGTHYANSSLLVTDIQISENCIRGKIKDSGWITISDPSKAKPSAYLILHAEYVDFSTSLRAKFQPRYLVLTSDNQLSAYTDDSLRGKQGTLDLKGADIQVGEQGFQIKNRYRTWIFSPKNETEKQQWLNVLRIKKGGEDAGGEGEPNPISLLRRASAPAYEAHLEAAKLELPPNWQEAKSPDGRVYYVNHVNKTTQWRHPGLPSAPS